MVYLGSSEAVGDLVLDLVEGLVAGGVVVQTVGDVEGLRFGAVLDDLLGSSKWSGGSVAELPGEGGVHAGAMIGANAGA